MASLAFRSTLAIALLVAACGSTGEEPADPTSAAQAPQAPASSAAPPRNEDGLYEVVWDEDIVYYDDGQEQLEMDVLHPDGGGPWPLVVVYHGRPAGPSISEARQIAARGAVAVAPRWASEWNDVAVEDYIDGRLFDRAACAVGKAQQIAGDFGADPSNTTVSGFSAGVHPA